jgi:hypothetical protein
LIFGRINDTIVPYWGYMRRSDTDKIVLLKILQGLGIPVNIHEILKNLPKGSAERSVRRWLGELARENLVEKTGRKRSTRYCIPVSIPTLIKEEIDRTFQIFKVDIKRAVYRKERRQVLAKIILTKKRGPAIGRYITAQAQKLIPQKDRLSFIEDTKEDLAALDTIRIAGLGVTAEEFREWKRSLLK